MGPRTAEACLIIRSVLTHLEHQLPAQVPSFTDPVRRDRVRQRIDLDLWQAHCAARHELDDALEVRAIASDFRTERGHIRTR